MTPFKDHPKTCPKCGGEVTPWYGHADACSYVCRAEAEHLHWTCGRCGYRFGITATMDAGPTPEQPEPPVEQPQSDGAASGVGDGLDGLRKAIQEELSRERRSVDPLIAKDIYRKAVGIVRHQFSRSTLVAFDRRDFELLDKHVMYPFKGVSGFWRSTAPEVHPDYLSALRAAIAEARRREGGVKS